MPTTNTMETEGGILGPVEAGRGRPLELDMQRLLLTGTVLPVGARLRVIHTFATADTKPVEVVYAFMLPRDAALRSFQVEGPGFSAHSELRPVEEAERIYEEGLEEGHLATYARTHRDGVVNLAVGNLRGGEPVTVTLEILAGVDLADEGYRFRFPFTLAPSYHREARVVALPEGGAVELPEHAFGDVLLPRWHTDARGLHEIGFALDVAGPGTGVEVASPSHPIRVGSRADGLLVSLATAGEVPDRDLVLDVGLDGTRTFALGGPAGDGASHFAAVVPSVAFGTREETPRTVVFLLDRSGSMNGEPMQQARRALAACLAALDEQDRFAIVAFDNSVEFFSPILRPASRKEREAAARWLERIDARGGTELAAGVAAAARLLGSTGGDIFVITDGQVFATEDVLASVKKAGARLHTLGIGSASQDRFLTLLARRTGGVSRFVTPRERVDTAALDLFASVARPVAQDLAVEAPEGCDLRPAPPETVFPGTPVVLWGRADDTVPGALTLTFSDPDGEGLLEVPLTLHGQDLGETVRLLRGARLITDLESTLDGAEEAAGAAGRRTGRRKLSRLASLSSSFGLASRAMALVAVVERAGDRPGELPETRVVPVGLPDGMVPAGVFGAPHVVKDFLASYIEAPPKVLCCVLDAIVEDPGSSPPPGPEMDARTDELLDLLARLEPDGGMPGSTPEARILATVLVLLAAAAQGSSTRRGPCRAHVRRMVRFVEATLPAGLPADRREAVKAAVAAVRGEQVAGWDWLELAGSASGDDAGAWEALLEAAEEGAF